MRPFSQTLIERLSRANRVGVLTGAGISKESGLATFRDLDGLWTKFRPEELANIDAFLSNPELVQSWYRERQRAALETQPNPGHIALADLEKMVPQFTLITQNVDHLHQRAGSKNLLELHGSIMNSFCIDCGKAADLSFTEQPEATWPARCSSCQGLIRPAVVWFGEMLPRQTLESAYKAAQTADVFLSIGTSAQVYPAADLPLVALDHGAYVAEINVEQSAIGAQLHETVLGKSGETLPDLIAALLEFRKKDMPA